MIFKANNDYKNILLCSDNKGLVIELFHAKIYNLCNIKEKIALFYEFKDAHLKIV